MDNPFQLGKLYRFNGLNGCVAFVIDEVSRKEITELKPSDCFVMLEWVAERKSTYNRKERSWHIVKVLTSDGHIGNCSIWPEEIELEKNENNL